MTNWRLLIIIAVCLLALHSIFAEEAVATLYRKILLPDGKPAIGVKVTFRTISYLQKRLLQEAEVVTDAVGTASKEMVYEKGTSPRSLYGYIIVDAPECALAFGNFNISEKEETKFAKNYSELKLIPAYKETGKIINAETKEPVTGATVAVVTLGGQPFGIGLPINIPSAGIKTPELISVTGDDGVIQIRGMKMEYNTSRSYKFSGDANGTITAIIKIGDKTFIGELSNCPFGTTKSNKPDMILYLHHAVSVSGRVIDSITKMPLSGVQVTLCGEPEITLNYMMPLKTDINGQYSFPAVPGVLKLFAEADCKNYGIGYTQVYPLIYHNGVATPLNESVIANDIIMRPMTTITGKIIDETTEKAPLTIMNVNAIYSKGYDDGPMSVGRGVNTVANADGVFTMNIPVGASQARITGIGYSNNVYFNINPGDVGINEYKVKREKGCFIKFETNEPQKLLSVNIYIRYKPESEPIYLANSKNIDANGYWYYYPFFVDKGQKVIEGEAEIRITRNRDEELLPWTKIKVDPNVWPLIIKIP